MSINRIFIILYTITVIADVIGEIFGFGSDFRFVRFLIPSLLSVSYFFNSTRYNILYLLSLAVMFAGLYSYNLSVGSLNPTGLLLHALSLLFYAIIILRNVEVYTKKSFLYFIPIFIICCLLPFYLFLQQVSKDLYIPITIFSLILMLVFSVSVLNFLNNQSEANKKLLVAALLLTTSALVSGYRFYFKISPTISALDAGLYAISHYFMYRYVLQLETDKLEDDIVSN